MSKTVDAAVSLRKKIRDSNIESFRIFLILIIIAHHYVVNSGITAQFDYTKISGNQWFLELWGWGGKTGINCFLLITGYFMCKQQFTWKKFLKLYLEVKFYKILIFAIFCISGYEAFTAIGLFKNVFSVAYEIGHGFIATFVGLFLLIPFINKLILSLDKKQHLLLIVLLTTIYTIFGTFFGNSFHENVGWFATVYIIGSFLRLYPFKLFSNQRLLAILSIACFLLAWSSIIAISFLHSKGISGVSIYYFVNDSHRILAIVCAVVFFLFFSSINLGQNRIINTIASTTLGVLLIHAHSGTMRQWLWNDVLHVSDYFTNNYLWLHAVCSLLIVYMACVILDLIRQRLIERPFFEWLGRRFPNLK